MTNTSNTHYILPKQFSIYLFRDSRNNLLEFYVFRFKLKK